MDPVHIVLCVITGIVLLLALPAIAAALVAGAKTSPRPPKHQEAPWTAR